MVLIDLIRNLLSIENFPNLNDNILEDLKVKPLKRK